MTFKINQLKGGGGIGGNRRFGIFLFTESKRGT